MATFNVQRAASFSLAAKAARERFHDTVAITFVHFPLPYHRFADAYSRAAICAGEQGRFEAFHDLLFERQESFGEGTSLEALAKEASILDVPRFSQCLHNPAVPPEIIEGKRLAKTVNLDATPTVVVNGWRFVYAPTDRELVAIIEGQLKGVTPLEAISNSKRAGQ